MKWEQFWFFALGFVACIVLSVLALFMIGIYYAPSSAVASTTIQTSSSEIIIPAPSQCSNLDLLNTSYCLHEEIAGIFNYSVRDDVERTLQDIEENGGDCFDYNLLYYKWMNELGFEADMIQFTYSENASHLITLTWDETAYCILDQQLEPDCVLLGDMQ